MLKQTVALAFGISLALPACVCANEIAKATQSQGKVADFLQDKSNSLYGIDAPGEMSKEAGKDGFHQPTFFEYSPAHRIESGARTKGWLIPSRLESSEDQHCNGKSVEDFLKGVCNKLHGFDIVSPDREKKLPPAWGGDQFITAPRYGEYKFQQTPFFQLAPNQRFDPTQNLKPSEHLLPKDFNPQNFGLPDANPQAK